MKKTICYHTKAANGGAALRLPCPPGTGLFLLTRQATHGVSLYAAGVLPGFARTLIAVHYHFCQVPSGSGKWDSRNLRTASASSCRPTDS